MCFTNTVREEDRRLQPGKFNSFFAGEYLHFIFL